MQLCQYFINIKISFYIFDSILIKFQFIIVTNLVAEDLREVLHVLS